MLMECWLASEQMWVLTKFNQGKHPIIKIYTTAENVTRRTFVQKVDGKLICYIQEKE